MISSPPVFSSSSDSEVEVKSVWSPGYPPSGSSSEEAGISPFSIIVWRRRRRRTRGNHRRDWFQEQPLRNPSPSVPVTDKSWRYYLMTMSGTTNVFRTDISSKKKAKGWGFALETKLFRKHKQGKQKTEEFGVVFVAREGREHKIKCSMVNSFVSFVSDCGFSSVLRSAHNSVVLV